MIDIYQLRVLREIRRMSGPVLCLWDQRPSRSTGFSTSSELFLSLGYTEVVDVDYNGLAPLGTLIFKWNEHRVPVSSILALTPEKPLFGQRCGTTARSHWIVWMKSPNATGSPTTGGQP